MALAAGSLVRARGREWVVQPESRPELLLLRPLGGTQDEVTGILPELEKVEPARFDWPDPSRVGDHRTCRLLREAVRLGFRSSTGPFRCLARLAFEPRPYQLVPLLMALKLDPVRLLIADDVGVGKTIEALLVARELLDRGEARGLAVLCPPHLAEQWQAEMSHKFHLEAELVLPGTVGRLERGLPPRRGLFEHYPCTVVSTDFIKADRHRLEFLRTCPDLVIVDEAHTCVDAGGRARHQRYDLVSSLAADPRRHLLLVTATPHSGKEDAFRTLLALLHRDFAGLPEDLSGPQAEPLRRRLAGQLVQRRRGDLRRYLEAETPFPQRQEAEQTYSWSPAYRRFFEEVLDYARQRVADPSAPAGHRQRLRWWSMLALLRSVASSPAAAAATLRTRASVADTTSDEEADEIGRRTVLDLVDEDTAEASDLVPGSDLGEEEAGPRHPRGRMAELARQAEALQGQNDPKLEALVPQVRKLLDEGFHPILFCRFIPTAEYLAQELRQRLAGVEVASVTGTLPPAEREERVVQLARAERRVLVCTDCLSEGINLQEHFDAVIHYDLAWNPTRHEQREGRVDRFGQPRPVVRVLTWYGADNPVDGVVLDVLLRKHKRIRSALGISVPVPADPAAVVEALMEGLLLRGRPRAEQLDLFDFARPVRQPLHADWELALERETRSRTLFAQESLRPEEVAREWQEARAAMGSAPEVERFVRDVVEAHGGTMRPLPEGAWEIDLAGCPTALAEALGGRTRVVRFEPPAAPGQTLLNRTHPAVEQLAAYVVDTALDPLAPGAARRCGAIRTRRVARRTTLLLVRLRFHLIHRLSQNGQEQSLLAEECRLAAFAGPPDRPDWLPEAEAEALLTAEPEAPLHADQASEFVDRVVRQAETLSSYLEELAGRRAQELLEAHLRVRGAARQTGVRTRVEPQLPPDVLGIYILFPVVG